MYLLLALRNPLHPTVFQNLTGNTLFEPIRIFVPMGLYMDQKHFLRSLRLNSEKSEILGRRCWWPISHRKNRQYYHKLQNFGFFVVCLNTKLKLEYDRPSFFSLLTLSIRNPFITHNKYSQMIFCWWYLWHTKRVRRVQSWHSCCWQPFAGDLGYIEVSNIRGILKLNIFLQWIIINDSFID